MILDLEININYLNILFNIKSKYNKYWSSRMNWDTNKW